MDLLKCSPRSHPLESEAPNKASSSLRLPSPLPKTHVHIALPLSLGDVILLSEKEILIEDTVT